MTERQREGRACNVPQGWRTVHHPQQARRSAYIGKPCLLTEAGLRQPGRASSHALRVPHEDLLARLARCTIAAPYAREQRLITRRNRSTRSGSRTSSLRQHGARRTNRRPRLCDADDFDGLGSMRNMGLRLRVGVGPLRASVPLTPRSPKRIRTTRPAKARSTPSRRPPVKSSSAVRQTKPATVSGRAKAWLSIIGIVAVIGGISALTGGSKSVTPPSKPVAVISTTSPTVSSSKPARHHRHHHHHHRATPSPTQPAVAPATHAAPPAPPASCYPISDEGTCYEPGEYCRYADEGMTGLAGDGETIECEDNDGLRWEPV
jgi:hypothetical protein